MVSEYGFSVKLLCKVLELSRSGYYAWLRRPASARQIQTEILTLEVKRIHQESRGTYGVPRIKAKLNQLDFSPVKSIVPTIIKKSGIYCLKRRRFKVKTTDSNHENPIAERIFKTEEPHTHPEKRTRSGQVTSPTSTPMKESYTLPLIWIFLVGRLWTLRRTTTCAQNY